MVAGLLSVASPAVPQPQMARTLFWRKAVVQSAWLGEPTGFRVLPRVKVALAPAARSLNSQAQTWPPRLAMLVPGSRAW